MYLYWHKLRLVVVVDVFSIPRTRRIFDDCKLLLSNKKAVVVFPVVLDEVDVEPDKNLFMLAVFLLLGLTLGNLSSVDASL